MQFLAALIIALPALTAAAPTPRPEGTLMPGATGGIITTAVIPPECAGLSEIKMSCNINGRKQCDYIDAAGNPAKKETANVCATARDNKMAFSDIMIEADELERRRLPEENEGEGYDADDHYRR